MTDTKFKELAFLTDPSGVKDLLSPLSPEIFKTADPIKSVEVSVLQLYQDDRSYNATLGYMINFENGDIANIVASSSFPVSNEYGFFAGKAISDSMGETEVKIPRYFAYIKEYNLILREYIPGKRLAKYISENKDISPRHIDSLMKWLAHFQRIKPHEKMTRSVNLNDLESNLRILRDSKPSEAYQQIEAGYAKIRNDIISWSEKFNQTLVHGDFNPANILINGEEISVIDFESAHSGDRVTDPANLSAYISILLRESGAVEDKIQVAGKNLISAYEKYSGKMSEDEIKRFYTYAEYFTLLYKAYALVWSWEDTSE